MGCGVLAEYVDVGLLNPFLLQRREAALNKKSCQAFSAEIRRYGKVMQIASSAVMTGHDAAHDKIAGTCDEAEAGVALKVTLGCIAGISGSKLNSGNGAQECLHRIIVGHRHWFDDRW